MCGRYSGLRARVYAGVCVCARAAGRGRRMRREEGEGGGGGFLLSACRAHVVGEVGT